MEEASPQLSYPTQDDFASVHGEALPIVVVHFNLQPGITYSWRVAADADLRVYGAQAWLTRIHSQYDHWLPPGTQMRLQSGERVWISTEGPCAARISITSLLPAARNPLRRWLGRLLRLNLDFAAPRRY
ncbi:conserved hypothetical protein [Burkholderia sp. H160]|nr:conserved hypothetical protein [Burkholderia sp. H160]